MIIEDPKAGEIVINQTAAGKEKNKREKAISSVSEESMKSECTEKEEGGWRVGMVTTAKASLIRLCSA